MKYALRRRILSITLAQSFICSRYETKEEIDVPVVMLCNGIKKINGFCYLGDRLNASGDFELAVTSRVRTEWSKFRKCCEDQCLLLLLIA